MSTQISIHAQSGITAHSHNYQDFPNEGWVVVRFLSQDSEQSPPQETVLHIHSLDRTRAARLAQAINEVFAHDEAERHADSQDAA